jgi:hypothetical protein
MAACQPVVLVCILCGGRMKTHRQIDELKARNRELEAKLQMAGTGESDALPTKQKSIKCIVVGDSIVRSVGAEHVDMKVECFPGIRTEQLHRVIEKRDQFSSDTVIIHVGTNDLKTTRNLDFVMGEVYALVSTARKKLPNCRLVLSGVLRRRDVSWRRIGALNYRFDWVANALGLTLNRSTSVSSTTGTDRERSRTARNVTGHHQKPGIE